MTQTSTATVTGMHCASCALGIETFLRSQDEIQRATVDYETAQLTIEHPATLDLDVIWERLNEMGYQINRT